MSQTFIFVACFQFLRIIQTELHCTYLLLSFDKRPHYDSDLPLNASILMANFPCLPSYLHHCVSNENTKLFGALSNLFFRITTRDIAKLLPPLQLRQFPTLVSSCLTTWIPGYASGIWWLAYPVPFFPQGIYMKDLTFIAEGNPDFFKGGLINLTKRRQASYVKIFHVGYQANSYLATEQAFGQRIEGWGELSRKITLTLVA